jgi:membrane-associated protease RseP (regulator of RpoE activity)
MKHVLLGSIAVLGLLMSMPIERAAAQLRQPTVDEQFRDRAPAELPLLNPPQPKPTIEKQTAVNSSGPAYFGVTFASDATHAVVGKVAPGSPAEQAGLQPQDVIESLQGIAIDSPQDVLDIIAKMRPGTMLNIDVSRRVSLRAQAPLASLPAGIERSVGYPPDATTAHEPLPVPSNATRSIPTYSPQSNRYAAPQGRSGSASGQQRNYNSNQNDNNRQQDNGRRILGLGRRRG